MLSPFGPALQFGGGSIVISASSRCIRFTAVLFFFEAAFLLEGDFAGRFGTALELSVVVVVDVLAFVVVLADWSISEVSVLRTSVLDEADEIDVDIVLLFVLLLLLHV